MHTLADDMKLRVERLLNGHRNVEDLTKLLLWLRSKCGGSVREIGDFIAHFDERKRGPTTEEMVDYFLWRKLVYQAVRSDPSINNGDGHFSYDHLPPDFSVGLKALVRTIGNANIALACEVPEYRIPIILANVIAKAKKKLDGDYSLKNVCNPEEFSFMRNIVEQRHQRSLYTLDKVYDDLIINLTRYNIAKHNDPRLSSIKLFYGLFICTIMDKCRLKMPGVKASLSTVVSQDGKLLVVAQALMYTSKAGGRLIESAPFFWTDLKAADVMARDVRISLSDRRGSHSALEIGPDEKLRFIA